MPWNDRQATTQATLTPSPNPLRPPSACQDLWQIRLMRLLGDTCPCRWWDAPPPPQACLPPRSRALVIAFWSQVDHPVSVGVTVWKDDKVAADQVAKANVALKVFAVSGCGWRNTMTQENQAALHSRRGWLRAKLVRLKPQLKNFYLNLSDIFFDSSNYCSFGVVHLA